MNYVLGFSKALRGPRVSSTTAHPRPSTWGTCKIWTMDSGLDRTWTGKCPTSMPRTGRTSLRMRIVVNVPEKLAR